MGSYGYARNQVILQPSIRHRNRQMCSIWQLTDRFVESVYQTRFNHFEVFMGFSWIMAFAFPDLSSPLTFSPSTPMNRQRWSAHWTILPEGVARIAARQPIIILDHKFARFRVIFGDIPSG